MAGIFLENNYKIQTISLVRKRFKHIWFITIRVQCSRFPCYKIEYIVLELPVLLTTDMAARCHVDQKSSSMNLFFGLLNRVHWTRFVSAENEFKELGFWALKPSSKNSVSGHRNQVLWTRFLGKETEFKELGLLKTLVTHPCTFKKTYTDHFPLTLGLSLTLWLSSVSVSLSLSLSLSDSPPSPSSSSLPSLHRRCRLSHSFAIGVTSQSCERPRPLCRRRRLSHSLAVSLTHSTPSLLFS